MLRSFTEDMNQLKPIIIVLLMLTSALAGCAGTDTTDLEQQIEDLQQSNDQMNETIYNMEITLQERNTEIATLNSNVAMLQIINSRCRDVQRFTTGITGGLKHI